MRSERFALVLFFSLFTLTSLMAQNPAATVLVDTTAGQHPISPLIYGTAFGDPTALSDLRCTLNRQGGNPASRYNWQINADNRAADWYFESIGYDSSTAGEMADTFIGQTKGAGADAMITIPLLNWVAKLGAGRSALASFSIAKYGAQTGHDPYFPDAGNGVSAATGQPIAGNDPGDANVPAGVAFQQDWVQHLVSRWGQASAGGLKYYLLDNEPSIWFSSHRDVQPVGAKMDEIRDRAFAFADMIKAQDPSAKVVGFEEWGWGGLLYSGYDQQYASEHGYCCYPDKDAHGGWDYMPYLLDQFRQHDAATGTRHLDFFSAHWYPQGGEFGDDVSVSTQRLRNRSTRSLWDPDYVDESWINDKVYLIPRMKQWAASYYPDTPVALTEYNWGAESHINGATAQADILGIFGREGLDAATRWTTPAAGSPVYNAMKMYRNADGTGLAFGDTGVSCSAPQPDDLSAFAAVRSADGALTVMVVNKDLSGTTPLTVTLGNFSAASKAQAWQLTAANAIARLTDVPVAAGAFSTTLPAPSVTLFVVPSAAVCSLTCSASAPATSAPGVPVSFTASATATGCVSQPAFAWTFGDGSTSAQQNPTHTYAAGGSFNWSVAVTSGSAACGQSGTIAVGSPVAVSGMAKASGPFRFIVSGSGFQSGVTLTINGTPWANLSYKGPAKLVIKGGSALKATVPRGQIATFHFANPDGGTADFPWKW